MTASSAWHVKPSNDAAVPTLLANSTLDRATIEVITSGKKPFPNYSEIPLTPQRELLHEIIVQAVTERKINATPTASYEKQLEAAVLKVTSAPQYQALAAKGTFSQRDVSALLDATALERLPMVESDKRITVLMATAGPATGKTALIETLATKEPEIYRNAAIVNSDDYKPLLARKAEYGSGYANAAHAESAFLSDKIMARLSQQIDLGRAPHVVLDIVTLSEQRMAFAQKSGQLIVATGTAPPDITLERSEKRGKETGRVVPTDAVLAGTRAVSATTPRIFEHPNVQMELFDTNVPYRSPHKLVAKYEGSTKTLVIHNPDTFIDFVERQNLNPQAKSTAQLFTPNVQTPESIAQGLKSYTDRGVTLAFLDARGELAMSVSREGVDQVRPLVSQRGNIFFSELAGAATALASGRQQHIEGQQRAQVEEHVPTEPRKTQNPIPIIVPPTERGVSQNPVPILVSQGERGQTPPPILVTRPATVESPPQRTSLPGKVGIAGAAAQLAIGPVFEATLSVANDGNASDITKAGLHGLANAALPGVTSGFKNITENNQHQNRLDQILNAGTTATQGVAVSALAVAGGSAAAAPVTGGASLTVTAGSMVVAGVSGVANLGIGVAHDVTYWTGLSKQGGLITGLAGMAGQLADSKAAHRTADWFMDNDTKVQRELAAKGIKPNQLAAVDENHDGKITAQETRDYLIKHHVAAEQVNSLAAKELAGKLAGALSTDMMRALSAAKDSSLSNAIRCDIQPTASLPQAPHSPSRQQTQGAAACR
jgi:hypothetical protein